jgi:predicted alpha/beta hydrolase family esterase
MKAPAYAIRLDYEADRWADELAKTHNTTKMTVLRVAVSLGLPQVEAHLVKLAELGLLCVAPERKKKRKEVSDGALRD